MTNQYCGFRATKPVARIIDPSKNKWEVFFLVYTDDGTKIPVRHSRGINSLPVHDRRPQANAMASVFYKGLKDGWNPLKDKYPSFEKGEPPAPEYTFEGALQYGLDKKRPILSKYSMYDYSGCLRFIVAAAARLQLRYEPIGKITRRNIKEIIAEAKESNNWSAKARNKYLTILRSLLGVAEEDELIETNPAARIKMEREEETAGYRRLTDEEKERIAEKLMAESPDFFDYLMFIYDDGIRRKETLMLQVRDVNMIRREIRIRPEVAKTNNARTVPITPAIMAILEARDIYNLPPDYYIFSSNNFRPGPEPYHPNTPTNWWRKLVIIGLGIDCKMYSLKHKGADDKIESGISLEVLRSLYGHKSYQMTEIYAKAVREKHKQQIIDNSPAFAKVVQMKRKVV